MLAETNNAVPGGNDGSRNTLPALRNCQSNAVTTDFSAPSPRTFYRTQYPFHASLRCYFIHSLKTDDKILLRQREKLDTSRFPLDAPAVNKNSSEKVLGTRTRDTVTDPPYT